MSFEVPLTPASYTLSRATPPSKLDLPAVVPLDEPPMNGITIQPPTAVLQDTRPAPVDTTTNAWRSTLKGLPSAGSPSQVSPGGRSSRSGLGSASVSPSTRSRQHRALSPDLPTRDCLYLFSNFSSYMRSPNEGPQGISGNEDFKDTIRLLDFARVSPVRAMSCDAEFADASSSATLECPHPSPEVPVSVACRNSTIDICFG